MAKQSWSNPDLTDQQVSPPGHDDRSHAAGTLKFRDPALVNLSQEYQGGFAHRRLKAAFVLVVSWGLVFGLYQVAWGSWLVLGFASLLGIQAIRLLKAKPHVLPQPLCFEADGVTVPTIALVVAAKNEELVIGTLVEQLCQVDYPDDRYEIWIVDDHSDDRTPEILADLQRTYPKLHVLRRDAHAQGGKSGALNAVLTKTQVDILAVFDADAQVPPDMLRQVLPLFENDRVGAVQTRKGILNHSLNFWTKGQSIEMMLDSFFQHQRISYTGLGELRGNGQFIRRSALAACGYFNEETITDDLDLTFRLHLNGWDIEFCIYPAVGEEGVTGLVGLWHQRNRWGEGGYQRYLDYWRLIAQNRMGTLKTIDVLSFGIMQYILPSVAIPDLMLAVAKHRVPVLAPLSTIALSLTLTGLVVGVRRVHRARFPETPLPLGGLLIQVLRGFFYMFHWFAIVGFTSIRMALLPKRLKWVKTVHSGGSVDPT